MKVVIRNVEMLDFSRRSFSNTGEQGWHHFPLLACTKIFIVDTIHSLNTASSDIKNKRIHLYLPTQTLKMKIAHQYEISSCFDHVLTGSLGSTSKSVKCFWLLPVRVPACYDHKDRRAELCMFHVDFDLLSYLQTVRAASDTSKNRLKTKSDLSVRMLYSFVIAFFSDYC